MAERKPAKKGTTTSAATASGKASEGFTDEEKAAMKERAQELKAAARRGPRASKADGEADVLAKIAEMQEPDRAMAERLHAIVKASAPALVAENLVRDARVRPGRQGRLLLPERAEVQDEVRDVRLQRRGESRRGLHVADWLRVGNVVRRRRGKNRRAREEGGELRLRAVWSSLGDGDLRVHRRRRARRAARRVARSASRRGRAAAGRARGRGPRPGGRRTSACGST